jgi:hypothetical protein
MHLPANKKLTFSYRVERGRQRFRELIVYVSERCQGDPSFGFVKLNKVLYFADFMAFERFGQPLTGMTYQKLEHGPAARAMPPIMNELVAEGAIRIEVVPRFGKPQKRAVPQRPANTDIFYPDEMALVDEVITYLDGRSAREVSDISHDIRWESVQLGDAIPYEFIFFEAGKLTEEDITRSKELARQFGWN